MKKFLLKLWHLSPAQLYIILRYSVPTEIQYFVELQLHKLGYSKYPEAIAVDFDKDPMDMPEITLGSIVRYPTGQFYKVIEYVPQVHIRFKHMDDINQEESNA